MRITSTSKILWEVCDCLTWNTFIPLNDGLLHHSFSDFVALRLGYHVLNISRAGSFGVRADRFVDNDISLSIFFQFRLLCLSSFVDDSILLAILFKSILLWLSILVLESTRCSLKCTNNWRGICGHDDDNAKGCPEKFVIVSNQEEYEDPEMF